MCSEKCEKAIGSFKSGLNCAQSVVSAYADDLEFDLPQALRISCGFGGGMGRLQETCGAVTGSFMVLGIYNCKKYQQNQERKNKTYAMIQEFNKRFKEIHGATDCRTLLNCDLRTEEGQQYLREHNLHEAVCESCIRDSIQIIQELTEE